MKKIIILSLSSILVLNSCKKVERPWQQFNNPGVKELAENFKEPPVEYSLTFYWGWDGKITEEVIARDLDAFKERGVYCVTLESGYDMGHPYLSEGWLKMVQKTVELARERDMRVWIVDEGKYPSGFAGGKFTTDAPELRMKALVMGEVIELKKGESLSKELSEEVVSAVAFNTNDSTNQVLKIKNGTLSWTAPEGKWMVILVKHDFRSSPTRAVNNPTRGKDPSNSLCDYLDSAATTKFIEFTHEQHKKYVGKEFGKTVLGFRGDEPDYSIRGIPWTPAIFEKFQEMKGYDVQPWVASFFTPKLTKTQKLVKADYWDVWSTMFAKNFFKVQADWCKANKVEYLVHLNKEDNLIWLVAHEGDFFKDMRHAQMPGVDAIWNQIWPDKVNDYPKYASSASHVYGKPRAFTESFAAYRTKPGVEEAKWVLDHQFVRGINMVEVMFVPASINGKLGLADWTADEKFASVAKYIHRTSYMLSQGKPAANIGVYFPTTSLWLNHEASNESILNIIKQLLEHQRDFDVVDEYALSSGMKLKSGSFINASEQAYQAIVIPEIVAISKAALDRLKQFEAGGGKVISLSQSSPLIIENTFKEATEKVDLSQIATADSGNITPKVLEALPKPDLIINGSFPYVKYTHRHLKDADLYFLFNESKEPQIFSAKLKGTGYLQVWDLMTGEVKVIGEAINEDDMANTSIDMAPWETVCIIIGAKP